MDVFFKDVKGKKMSLSNIIKSEISYQHQPLIEKLFKKNILGELFINHFSVNVFFGDESLFLSSTPQMAKELCKFNFVDKDSNYKKDIYKTNAMYSWKSVQSTSNDAIINHIKEKKFNMNHGMMIVRNLGEDRYVMYSFASHKKEEFEGLFHFLYRSKADYIAHLGDWMYNELNEVVNQYSSHYQITMPKISNHVSLNSELSLDNSFQEDTFEFLKTGTIEKFTQSVNRRTANFLNSMDKDLIAHV